MAAIHIADATWISSEAVTPKDWVAPRKKMSWRRKSPKTAEVEKWLEMGKKGLAIHAYADWPSLERVQVGLALVKREGDGLEILNTVELKEIQYNEPRGMVHELENIRGAGAYVFEEFPFVEIRNKDDWDVLADIHRTDYVKQWGEEEYKKRGIKYQGPGVYDGRDMGKEYKSALDYEMSDLETESDDVMDYIFSGGLMPSDLQGDEWVKAFDTLLTKVEEESSEESEEEGGEGFE